jgi:hypothetical protein
LSSRTKRSAVKDPQLISLLFTMPVIGSELGFWLAECIGDYALNDALPCVSVIMKKGLFVRRPITGACNSF